MRRREFVGLFGGAAAWPLAALAQQPAIPVIGFVRSTSLVNVPHFVTGLREGLKEVGFIDGQNILIESRSAEDQIDRLRAVVAELIDRPVAVFVGDTTSMHAAKDATKTIPIIFTTGGDPVRDGLVANLNRPGGNVTGVIFLNAELGAKRLELLRQLVPPATTIAMLVAPTNPIMEVERRDVQVGAQAVGQKLIIIDVRSDRDIETAFATFVQRHAGALLVGSGAFLNSKRERLVALAADHALPTSYVWREAVLAGGLMSYGASQTDAHRQAGIYAGRILKGEKPADLPVVRSTKLEFVINIRTARVIGLEVSPSLLARADEVIE